MDVVIIHQMPLFRHIHSGNPTIQVSRSQAVQAPQGGSPTFLSHPRALGGRNALVLEWTLLLCLKPLFHF